MTRERGTDTYSFSSYKEFCSELGVDNPLDRNFLPKCIEFFKGEGKGEDDAKSICYVGFQKKYKNMQDTYDNDEVKESISEENEYYPTDRSIEKRRIARNTLNGLSPTGKKKRKDTGRRKSRVRYKTDRADSFEDTVRRLIDNGYPTGDAIKIAAMITLGIKDRIDHDVAGNISARYLKKKKNNEFDQEMPSWRTPDSGRGEDDEEDPENGEDIDTDNNLLPDDEDPENGEDIDTDNSLLPDDEDPENGEDIDTENSLLPDEEDEDNVGGNTRRESFIDKLDGIFLIEKKKKKKKKKKTKKRSRNVRYSWGGGYYGDTEASDGGGDSGGE